ncbi:MAG TPA: hypothetical protein VNQ90_02130 [Chthoniobacteraceae bacterium]|nr:hypothetical protein [Chthoniobacteraceae bacterium]
MLTKLRSLLLLILVAVLPAGAETTSPEAATQAPGPPYVAPLPGAVSWRMEFHRDILPAAAPSGTPEAAVVTTIQSTKTTDLKRDRVHFSNGSVREIFYYAGKRIEVSPGSGKAIILPARADEKADDFLLMTPGLYGTAWVNQEFFQGKTKLKDRPAFHYLRQRSDDDPENRPKARHREIWIDAETLRPIRLVEDGTTIDYEFEPLPPSAAIHLPAPVATAIQTLTRQREKLERLRAMRNRP